VKIGRTTLATKSLLWLHIAFLVLAAIGIVLLFLVPSAPLQAIHSVTFWIAAAGFLTGLGSMACRSGKSESLMLAGSTIAALLMVLFCGLLTF
jgi:hypothetical protein